MVEIRRAESKKDLKLFERVAELVHADDPYFVPPFPGSEVKLVSPKGPFSKHGDVVCFIAYRDGKPVGRIAAVENRSHNAYYHDKVGFFGFFDFIDDFEVAKALYQAAQAEVKKRGLTSIRGPYSPSVNDGCGLLVEGFESSPMVLMSYNPPYYVEIYDRLGLKQARDLHAYYISGSQQAPERMLKIADRVKRSTGVQLRYIDKKHMDRDLEVIRKLFNTTLDRNWGFIPLTEDDMKAAAKELVQIVDPSLVVIAEKNEEPVGFMMVIPNVNEYMWRAKSSPAWLRILKFVWWLKTSRPKEARLALLGVKPEFRNKGLGALFYADVLIRGGQKFIGGELSWVEANNDDIIHGISAMGAKKYKNYRIFESPLGGATA